MSELHVQPNSHRSERANRAEGDNEKPGALKAVIDVSLKIQIVEVLLIHPEGHEPNNDSLKYHYRLGETGNALPT